MPLPLSSSPCSVRFGMRTVLRVLLLPPVLLMLAGCALSPATSDVAAFGTAATKAAQAVAVPDQVQTELLLKISVNRNACRYLKAQTYQLGSRPARSSLAVIKEQIKYVRALEAYSTALARVTDPAGLENLRAAANGFSDQVGAVATAAPFAPGAGAIVGPAAKVLVNAVVNVSELRRRHKIREIMATVDLSIVQGARRIRKDYKGIGTHLERLMTEWETSARCVLTQIRPSSDAGAVALFQSFDSQRRTYKAQIGSLNEAVNLVGDIARLHEKLLKSEGDPKALLDQFNQAIANLAALKTALISN